MEKYTFFNDVNGDRVYYAEDFARHLATYFTNGIFNNGCQVLGNNENMSVNVSIGSANINGYRYDNDAIKTLTIENADGVLNRIDNIVIRWDLTNRTITLQVIKGTLADSAVAPDLVRTSTIYDLRIAKISVPKGTTTITQDLISDTRFITSDCGNVISTVETPDTEDLFLQIETSGKNLINSLNNALSQFSTDSSAVLSAFNTTWNSFINTCDTTFSGKISGYDTSFDNKIDGYDTTFTSKLSGYDTSFNNKLDYLATNFNSWFDNIKGQLDSDAAAHLQNEINIINDELDNCAKDTNYVHTDNNYSNEEKNKVSAAATNITTIVNGGLKSFSATIDVGDWQLDSNQNYYYCNIVNSAITSSMLPILTMNRANKAKFKDADVQSYGGGVKVTTSELPEESISLTVCYQLANMNLGGNV